MAKVFKILSSFLLKYGLYIIIIELLIIACFDEAWIYSAELQSLNILLTNIATIFPTILSISVASIFIAFQVSKNLTSNFEPKVLFSDIERTNYPFLFMVTLLTPIIGLFIVDNEIKGNLAILSLVFFLISLLIMTKIAIGVISKSSANKLFFKILDDFKKLIDSENRKSDDDFGKGYEPQIAFEEILIRSAEHGNIFILLKSIEFISESAKKVVDPKKKSRNKDIINSYCRLLRIIIDESVKHGRTEVISSVISGIQDLALELGKKDIERLQLTPIDNLYKVLLNRTISLPDTDLLENVIRSYQYVYLEQLESHNFVDEEIFSTHQNSKGKYSEYSTIKAVEWQRINHEYYNFFNLSLTKIVRKCNPDIINILILQKCEMIYDYKGLEGKAQYNFVLDKLYFLGKIYSASVERGVIEHIIPSPINHFTFDSTLDKDPELAALILTETTGFVLNIINSGYYNKIFINDFFSIGRFYGDKISDTTHYKIVSFVLETANTIIQILENKPELKSTSNFKNLKIHIESVMKWIGKNPTSSSKDKLMKKVEELVLRIEKASIEDDEIKYPTWEV